MSLAATALTLLESYRSDPKSPPGKVHSLLLNTLLRHAPGPIYVSAAAQAEAHRRGIPGDLREYHWNQQVRVMGDKGRKIFAWDHFYPVAELRRRLDALESPTADQVRAILRHASIAWILKTEDGRLNELGFQHRRPDPAAAYEQAQIQLLHGPA
jgi:hypothetical protein